MSLADGEGGAGGAHLPDGLLDVGDLRPGVLGLLPKDLGVRVLRVRVRVVGVVEGERACDRKETRAPQLKEGEGRRRAQDPLEPPWG